MYVRHLGYDLRFDKQKLKKDLDNDPKIKIKSSFLGLGKVHLIDANQYFEFIKKKLSNNPHYLLLKKPKYKLGKLPFDGPTKGKDGIR